MFARDILSLINPSNQILKRDLIQILLNELNLTFEKIYTSEEKITEKMLKNLIFKFIQLADDMPLEYIINKAEFYGNIFEVSEDCLIPRQDSEILVQKTIEYIKQNENLNPKILDICSGSGCLGLSVLKDLTNGTLQMIDISDQTMNIAIKNAKKLSLLDKCKFKIFDIKQKEFLDFLKLNYFDVVLFNPPYIKEKEIKKLDKSVQFEPKIALNGGVDGLDFYRFFIEIYKITKIINPNIRFFIEIGYNQKQDISRIFQHLQIKFYKDLNKKDRMVVVF